MGQGRALRDPPVCRELGHRVALEVHSFEGRGKNVNGQATAACVIAWYQPSPPNRSGSSGRRNPYDEGEPLAETMGTRQGSHPLLHMKDMKHLPGGGCSMS